ncbi:hypothetical protein A7322_12685 [Lentilactobacillus parabuchneri]|nr:hypothetical protein A7322_12685 [Lentilactobacillus parabuchneri]
MKHSFIEYNKKTKGNSNMRKVYSFSTQGKYLILTRYYEFFSLDNDDGEKYNNVLEYFSKKDYKCQGQFKNVGFRQKEM